MVVAKKQSADHAVEAEIIGKPGSWSAYLDGKKLGEFESDSTAIEALVEADSDIPNNLVDVRWSSKDVVHYCSDGGDE